MRFEDAAKLNDRTRHVEPVKGATGCDQINGCIGKSCGFGCAVKELELLSKMAPAIPDKLAEPVFRWLSKMPGFHSSESEEKVMTALAKKKANRLLL